mmetsp:Transcript_53047/g.152889  ORF Transcript_53047/g.152889 Transcript_53047/m.152889 type:complete len:942 (+) Transcript_53047:178-3003(+)
MISTGEVFYLCPASGGELRPQTLFLNKSVRVLVAGSGSAYIACEPPVPPAEGAPGQCEVWRYRSGCEEPERCPEFDLVEGRIRKIAVGDRHQIVLTDEGAVYTRGAATFGCLGHGGARDAPEFTALPALRGKRVRDVAAGPYYSIAITKGGDVYTWGQAFQGETGQAAKVEAMPRFATGITPFDVVEVSCGQGHVLARTRGGQCVTWGENTCGQLGIGRKSPPTHQPQVLESIPPEAVTVSAGWAHSVVVVADGRAFAWGLNSHGQLGLGDCTTRMAPEIVEPLVGAHSVERAEASRTFTAFHTRARQVLLSGQVPREGGEPKAAPTECWTTPRPLPLRTRSPDNVSHSEMSQVIAFDKGVLGFAASVVYGVAPHFAPSAGGTVIRAFVTGLPFDAAPGEDGTLVQDSIPAKVRFRCQSPELDVVLDARVIDIDTVEFITPDVSASAFGQAVNGEKTTLPAHLSVSVDGGLTWTQDRQQPPEPADGNADATDPPRAPTTLWIAPWPKAGPSHVEPDCSPVAGGTELLLHIELPSKMPADLLTVKLVCVPLQSLDDPELHCQADDLAKLAPYDVPVKAWPDPGGRGIRCLAPKIAPAHVRLYSYSLELSLDGAVYLSGPLPFAVYDLRVVALEPSLGPLQEATDVCIKCIGAVPSSVKRVRLDFPEALGWPSRVVPAMLDHTTGDIFFSTPDLSAEARALADEERARVAAAAPPEGSEEAAEAAPAEAAVDPEGGLGGTQVVVELSLNGQNFTEDAVEFVYHSQLQPKAVELLARPDGSPPEQPKEDPKAKKGKGAVEEPTEIPTLPQSKLGVELVRGAMATEFAALRVDLETKVGDEDFQLYKTVDLPGRVEEVAPPPSPPPPEDPKAKNAPASPPPAEDLPPRDMVCALAPEVMTTDLPQGALLYLRRFQVSLNGRNFVPCPEGALPLRLEPTAPGPSEE